MIKRPREVPHARNVYFLETSVDGVYISYLPFNLFGNICVQVSY
jgi:hypothetical protein